MVMTPFRRAVTLLSVSAASFVVAAPARADEPAPPAAWETAQATRRSGFVLGASLGVGVASVAGYPNNATEEGYASYYTVTGVRPATFVAIWAGAAFTDWLTFALGAGAGRVFAGDPSSSAAFMFHIEAYPLFALGGRFQDLGVMFDAGTGPCTVTAKGDSGTKLVDGGLPSFIGGGVFYEGVRLWKVSLGPFISGNYYWSDTVRRPALFLGLRASLATGP